MTGIEALGCLVLFALLAGLSACRVLCISTFVSLVFMRRWRHASICGMIPDVDWLIYLYVERIYWLLFFPLVYHTPLYFCNERCIVSICIPRVVLHYPETFASAGDAAGGRGGAGYSVQRIGIPQLLLLKLHVCMHLFLIYNMYIHLQNKMRCTPHQHLKWHGSRVERVL